MKLTLGQVRGALGLTPDAYRHWNKVLLPLAVRKGQGLRFTHGDLLALAIVKSLTDQIGVPVGNLDSLARALFEQCGQQSWAKFERRTALIIPGTWNLTFFPDGQVPLMTQAAIIIPCNTIIMALRASLMIEQSDDTQATLKFPLSAVADRRTARGDKS